MAKTSHNISEWAQNGFESYISKSDMIAPFTEIQNRALVPAGLETSMGIERIPFNSVTLLADEVGPDSQVVYEIDSKDSRIRLVGDGWETAPGTGTGIPFVNTNSQGNFVEVTFYGTGLNILTEYRDASGATIRDWFVTIDGGVESSDITPTDTSAVLSNQSYRQNVVVNAASGLGLGWHTIKIRKGGAGANGFLGVEILNESSQLITAPGSGFSGTQKQTLSAQSAIDFKPAAMTGTKGGRIVSYLKDGQVQQAFTEVPNSPSYIDATNHSNEEITRRVNFREFGAGRGDDFSGARSTDNLAYTLDDGTTTLSGISLSTSTYNNYDVVVPAAVSANLNLTFVGTGLDIFIATGGATFTDSYTVFLDNVVIDAAWTPNQNTLGVYRFASGLPYGTHNIRFARNGGSSLQCGFVDFIIYQPKKPEIPADSIQLADYNVMADFVTATNSATSTGIYTRSVSQGVLRKQNVREREYRGSPWQNLASPASNNTHSGFFVEIPNGSTGDVSYTFFGTGFIYNLATTGSGARTFSVTIDGALNDSGIFRGAGTTSSNNGGGSYTVSNSQNGILEFTGLPLGTHKVTVTKTATTGAFYNDSLDIITPIHINDPSLKVGNLSMISQKNIAPVSKEEQKPSIGEAKALLHYNCIQDRIVYSKNISAVIDLGTGIRQVYLETPMKAGGISLAQALSDTVSSRNIDNSSGAGDVLRLVGCVVNMQTDTGAVQDTAYLGIAFFGELVDED